MPKRITVRIEFVRVEELLDDPTDFEKVWLGFKEELKDDYGLSDDLVFKGSGWPKETYEGCPADEVEYAFKVEMGEGDWDRLQQFDIREELPFDLMPIDFREA